MTALWFFETFFSTKYDFFSISIKKFFGNLSIAVPATYTLFSAFVLFTVFADTGDATRSWISFTLGRLFFGNLGIAEPAAFAVFAVFADTGNNTRSSMILITLDRLSFEKKN